MPFLVSLFSSGLIKWIAILTIVIALGGSLYLKHRQIVDMERETALQKYNINQLEQNLKDKDIYLKQMEEISNHKSQIVAELYIEKDRLEEQLGKINDNIKQQVVVGNDKRSSKILQDTIRMLGEIK